MKQVSVPFMAILLFPWVACNNRSANSTAMTAAPAKSVEAAMLLPDVKDTLLTSGRRNIYLVGRRNTRGYYVERSVFPAGYKGMPHVHNSDIYVTVIDGYANVAMGRVFDTTTGFKTYGPGSFFIIPADQAHYEWFPDRCTLQIEGVGPNETFYTTDSTKK